MSDDKCLLVITVPPSLEDTLADWLIGREESVGFSSTSVNGHGEGHEGYTLAEQVRGSRRNIQFQIQTTQLHADEMLADMERDFSHSELHYWIIPLLDGRRLSDRFAAHDAPRARPASEDTARGRAPPKRQTHRPRRHAKMQKRAQQQGETLPDQTRNGRGTGMGDGHGLDDRIGNGDGDGRGR